MGRVARPFSTSDDPNVAGAWDSDVGTVPEGGHSHKPLTTRLCEPPLKVVGCHRLETPAAQVTPHFDHKCLFD